MSNNDIPSRSNPAVTELVLYARNSPKMHNEMVMQTKYQSGIYVTATCFIMIASQAARAYRREFGNADAQIFTAHDLLQAAAELCEWYSQEYGANEG